MSPGTLYVVGVPIGNPEDITLRALRVLRNVDLVASEDPAATRAFLAQHGIETTVTSYGPRNLREKVRLLLHRLKQGSRVALVSDCGMPIVCDPGCLLVSGAHAHRIPVRCVPGPSVSSAAVAVSGASADALLCHALPDTRPAISRCLTDLLSRRETIVVFCTSASLAVGLEYFARRAPRRRLMLVCDLTTERERTITGTARHILSSWRAGNRSELATLILPGRNSHRGRIFRC